jgi:hypothetical protein
MNLGDIFRGGVVPNGLQQWPAMRYPDEPRGLSPEAASRRAKVRIGVKVARIALPVMLATGFAAVAGTGRDDSGGGSSTPLYSGDKIALAVRLQLHSHGLLGNGVSVDCGSSTLDVGAVSHCDELMSALGDDPPVPFEVHFLDTHGHFSFTAPGGGVLTGGLVG